MASSLFGAGNRTERSAQDIKAAQDAADAQRLRAAAAAGRDRRSIGSKR